MMFKRAFTLALLLAAAGVSAAAQKGSPATAAELSEITERGRQLAAYDVAAWHATDAVMALSPEEGSVTRYVAQKTGAGWLVVFGRLTARRDKFLILYEAAEGKTPIEFTVKKNERPKEETAFFLRAALALDAALADFRGENRPYNAAVLPARDNQLWVYVVPAQTREGIYPLGGDVRYLISADGTKIIEKRRLHNAILENAAPQGGAALVMGYHVAVLDDRPEDTDVFHVLRRKPKVPEMIATRNFVYRIEVDGTINYMGTVEAVLGVKK